MMQGRTSGGDRTARAQPKRRWVSAGPHLGGVRWGKEEGSASLQVPQP